MRVAIMGASSSKGRVAQLVEHHNGIVGVIGSIPFASTISASSSTRARSNTFVKKCSQCRYRFFIIILNHYWIFGFIISLGNYLDLCFWSDWNCDLAGSLRSDANCLIINLNFI